MMPETVLAAVRTGPLRAEFREFDMPEIPDDAALPKIEVAGICGTDAPPRAVGGWWSRASA